MAKDMVRGEDRVGREGVGRQDLQSNAIKTHSIHGVKLKNCRRTRTL